MVDDKDNDRLSHALRWCREHEVKARLNLFNRKRKKNLGKKEFEEMCKKAGVKKGSLCKTIFTENL